MTAPTASAFLAWCNSYVGTTESPPGSNKQPFAAMAGHPNGLAWCASYLCAGMKTLGAVPNSDYPDSASTRTGRLWYIGKGRWRVVGTEPKPGWWVYYDWPAGYWPVDHVETFVTKWGTGIVTIGGNTSQDSGGSQTNGGGVYVRHRSLDRVVGYGIPLFSTATQPAPLPTPEDDVPADNLFLIRKKDTQGVHLVAGPEAEHNTPYPVDDPTTLLQIQKQLGGVEVLELDAATHAIWVAKR